MKLNGARSPKEIVLDYIADTYRFTMISTIVIFLIAEMALEKQHTTLVDKNWAGTGIVIGLLALVIRSIGKRFYFHMYTLYWEWGWKGALAIGAAAACAAFLFTFGNQYLDSSEPSVQRATTAGTFISQFGAETKYYVNAALPNMRSRAYELSKEEYSQVKPQVSTLEVSIRPGYFGEPWISGIRIFNPSFSN